MTNPTISVLLVAMSKNNQCLEALMDVETQQWEYQIFAKGAKDAQIWVSRFYHPKPLVGGYPGNA